VGEIYEGEGYTANPTSHPLVHSLLAAQDLQQPRRYVYIYMVVLIVLHIYMSSGIH